MMMMMTMVARSLASGVIHQVCLSLSVCCVCVCSRGWGKVTEKRKKLGGLKRVRIRDGIKR